MKKSSDLILIELQFATAKKPLPDWMEIVMKIAPLGHDCLRSALVVVKFNVRGTGVKSALRLFFSVKAAEANRRDRAGHQMDDLTAPVSF